MNGNDRRPEAEWPIKRERRAEQSERTVSAPRRDRLGLVLLALGGLVALLVTVWLLSGNRDPDQDKLVGNGSAQARAADPEKLCSSQRTYDLIKRELFRRAAQMRGSDQAAFDKLASFAVLRMENPVMEGQDEDTEAVNCSGSMSLDLPPGVAVVGGRRSLTSDLDYSIQPATDGSGDVVLLRNADAIVAPLATLARVGAPATAPAVPANPDAVVPAQPGPSTNVPTAAPAQAPRPPANPSPPPAPARTSSARPSFNCGNASTRGEVAVCSDGGLAALDRQMAGQFNSAMRQAGPGERALLDRTRSRFLRYRDSCRSDACVADAYRGRMREIRDIAEGRWQPR
jgi:hypothetical protein